LTAAPARRKLAAVKVLLQRVSRAEVRVDGEVAGSIGAGLLVLLGIEQGDRAESIDWYADKTAELRIFADAEGKMNRSVEDIGGGVLVVSQFTLTARTRKGRRPSYARAAAPELAQPLYESFAARLAARGLTVETGRFGEMMDVELINDGPVTILLEPPGQAP
jgi:D-tyrosyl-tRNA(Tyr) deacylase